MCTLTQQWRTFSEQWSQADDRRSLKLAQDQLSARATDSPGLRTCSVRSSIVSLFISGCVTVRGASLVQPSFLFCKFSALCSGSAAKVAASHLTNELNNFHTFLISSRDGCYRASAHTSSVMENSLNYVIRSFHFPDDKQVIPATFTQSFI